MTRSEGRVQAFSAGWIIPDPATSGGDDQATLPAFRQVATELATRIGYLLAGFSASPDQDG